MTTESSAEYAPHFVRTLVRVRGRFQMVFWTCNQAPGALPNGTRVRKVLMSAGDFHPIGTQGVVAGSIRPDVRNPFHPDSVYLYWVKWDDLPDVPVGVTDVKIAPVESCIC